MAMSAASRNREMGEFVTMDGGSFDRCASFGSGR
jgi:hypothetical protein